MTVTDIATLEPITGRPTMREYLGQLRDRREFIVTMPRHELHAENLDTVLGNVWFLPSPSALCGWLAKAGFLNIRLVDVSQTGTDEQRTTDWMTFHSLAQFLDPFQKDDLHDVVPPSYSGRRAAGRDSERA